MSYNFLDKTGLSYFWGKIKSYFVNLTGTQTISGAKTFSSNVVINDTTKATFATSTTTNISPDDSSFTNPAWNKDLWHDHFAFLKWHTISSQESTTDGETWTTTTKDLTPLFNQKESVTTRILNADELAYRFTFTNDNFGYSKVVWFEVSVGYTSPFSSFNILIEFSSDNSTWTTIHSSNITSNSKPFFLKNNTSFTANGYLRFTFTKLTNLTTGTIGLTCIKAFTTRKGSQGGGSEYEYPYDWDSSMNILPRGNNLKSLGTSNVKWANVYATTFTGNLSGNATSATSATSATTATKATQDGSGNVITDTYATKTELGGTTANDLAVIATKEYSGIYGSANDQAGASFYFMYVRPVDFYSVWRVKYRITASVPNQNNYKQYSIVEFYGNQDGVSYKPFNRLFSTDYRCYMYHNLYRLNSTGYTNNYKHAIGVGLRDSTNRTSSDYARSFKVELLETENCTVTMLDTMIKIANVDGYGSTNFAGVTEANGGSNGLQETGDNDTTYQLRHNNGKYLAYTNLYRYMLCFSKDELTLLPANAVSNTTGTSKTLTTESFNPFGQILYYNSTTTVNANGSIGGDLLRQQTTFDLRYSFNTGSTLTNNKDVFIVCSPQSDGMVKLHSTPISQTLPTTADGLIYIYLGHAYSTYQIEMHAEHPIYEYKNGALRLYTNDSNKQDTLVSGTNIKTINNTSLLGSGNITIGSGGTSTDVQVNGTSITSGGVANIVTNSAYNSSSNKIATMSDVPDELADLSDDSTHRLVTDTEKTNWNGKQNALTTQTAYTSKGSATKVPQITTNTLGQVTGITEVNITQPDIQVNGTSIVSNNVANIVTEGTYDSSTNKISTMSDITGITGLLASLLTTDKSSLAGAINEVYNMAIIDSNTNTNGYYCKFSNGLMIVYKRINGTFIATTAAGSLYSGTFNLGSAPASFKSNTNVLVFAQAQSLTNISAYIDGTTTTSLGTWHFLRPTSTGSSGYGGYVDVFAVGQWK